VDDLIGWFREQLDEEERDARLADTGQRWEATVDLAACGPGVRTCPETVGDPGEWSRDVNYVVWRCDDEQDGCPEAARGWSAEARHIARHDPARVLAEVEVKRRILADHARSQSGFIWIKSAKVTNRTDVVAEWANAEGVKVSRVPLLVCSRCADWYPDAMIDEGSHANHGFPCLTVKLLALPYSDRPGYREEWRP
jgi:hypothetical protein